ncbi:short-chain dehydrogenase/reductase family 16C member 6 [Drosophila nasuta]|uniref:Short-chain dehydrogenase/reductase family 16C member 6 n=1 Tax=Drosophila albomicans TaxID=7291 RepID=A0A6P8XT02_DROAB|nr:short-chain dehydrogenase/reductase family 16C member 6 [Drosophila albomicans]XP_060649197.1 short-chain dehydrogenase/reductase family 16C member 6 [Drosophila nasuta]
MVETATTTTITRTTSSAPATTSVSPNSATPTAALVNRNDETTRAIFNLKVILFLLLLPLVLFGVFLKHLLDYLFSLGLKEKDVRGKVALVTGGGSGLGREICLELARRGCKVAVVDVNSKGCYETVELLTKIPSCTAKAYKNDVSSPRELQLMAAKVEKELGPVEILVNNASLMPMTSTPHLKSDEIDTILQLNLGSYIMTTKEFLPKMITRKSGHLVAVNALAGLVPLPGAGIYTATKYGIMGFMESLRAELRLSDCDYVRTTVANAYLMKTSGDLPLLSDAGISKSYPGLPTPYVAEKIVKGVLLNERMVYVPKIFALSVWLLRLLPTKWQDYMLLRFYHFDVRSAHLFYWKLN